MASAMSHSFPARPCESPLRARTQKTTSRQQARRYGTTPHLGAAEESASNDLRGNTKNVLAAVHRICRTRAHTATAAVSTTTRAPAPTPPPARPGDSQSPGGSCP